MPQRNSHSTIWSRLVYNTTTDDSEDACWNWTGKISKGGYPRINFRVDGIHRTYAAHRIALIVFTFDNIGITATRQDIQVMNIMLNLAGLEVDHQCHNTQCINPAHLEIVTPKQNAQNRRKNWSPKDLFSTPPHHSGPDYEIPF